MSIDGGRLFLRDNLDRLFEKVIERRQRIVCEEHTSIYQFSPLMLGREVFIDKLLASKLNTHLMATMLVMRKISDHIREQLKVLAFYQLQKVRLASSGSQMMPSLLQGSNR